MRKKLTIGLFGFGCVGSGLYEVLNRSGLFNAEIKTIVVKNKAKQRPIPEEHFKFDKEAILADTEINLVVELIDDAEAAYEIVTRAIRSGKHVVTANKKMIAQHLDELIALKNQYKVSFLYEASVCGSIPVIRNLEEYYNNDTLASVQGICNGTTNYILTRLDKEGKSFDEILKDAQDSGFAETDPTLDIDGFDAKFKLQILIAHAFGVITQPDQVLNIGIRHVKVQDIQYAREKGLKIKLIAGAEKIGNKVIGYVAPQFVKEDSFAFDVNYEFNAVSIEAAFSDKQVFKGKGAGSFPTASAVLSDISALQYDYGYEYRKKETTSLGYDKNFFTRIFISSTSPTKLNDIPFVEVEESFSSKDYAYKIGKVDYGKFNHALYRENPELFIGFFPENEHDFKLSEVEKEVEVSVG
ncbi:MAG: homoserine dehydrogenase [Crocinitomicaceae bacterium]|nr:homoserine dehydrogenase [Crocinitomicaceae bacterium]MBK8925736.1 homoserine dehydrogenase [Crocinitomicaceae bacterium]